MILRRFAALAFLGAAAVALFAAAAVASAAPGAPPARAQPDSAAAPAALVPATSFVFDGWSLEGDGIFAEGDLRRFAPWTLGDSLAVSRADDVAAQVRDALVTRGFWNAHVAARVETPGERSRVAMTIDAGEPATVASILVVGNRVLAREEILVLLDVREGALFDAAAIRAGCERVLRAYAERGRPLARIYPGNFRKDAGGAGIAWTLQIGEGPETVFEELRVLGATSTSPNVVGRIAGVRPGSPWDARRIEEIAPRLRREEIFATVGEPRVVRGSRDNRLAVEVDLEERKSSSILGVLGYVPKPTGGGTVVGLVDLRLGNILGTARRAAFHFERQMSDSRDLSFRFREPWLLGTPISAEVGAAQSLRDSLYSRTDLDAAFSVPIGWRSTVALAAERRESSIEVAGGSNLDETSTGGSVALAADRRDRRLDPSRGFEGTARVGVRRTESGVTRTRFESAAAVYVPLGGRTVLAEAAGYREVWATEGETPVSDHYFLGGTNTLRGYREEQFRGIRVWWARTEMRYRLANRSRTYAFVDVGGFVRREPVPEGGMRRESDVLPGWGVGLAAGTRSGGLMKVELALGRGDGFSDAKVHAALEQEF